jgi:transcriptional regulator with XRE-family HTH domain
MTKQRVFGRFLRSCRGKLSLREFANNSNISHTYIEALEKGKRPYSKVTLEILIKLAAASGCGIDKLLNMLIDDCSAQLKFKSKILNAPDVGVVFGMTEEFYRKNHLPIPDIEHIIINSFYNFEGEPVTPNIKKKLYALMKTLFEK